MTDILPQPTPLDAIQQEHASAIKQGLLGMFIDHHGTMIGEPGYVFRPVATPEIIETEAQRESRLRKEACSADGLTAAVAQYGVRGIELARDALVAEYIEVAEPILKRLNPHLEAVLFKSKRTRKEYCTDYNKFRRFWSDHGIPVAMPVRPELVALYMIAAAEDGKSYASLSRINTAIDNAHDVAEHRSPSNDPIVKAALKYAAAIKKAKASTPPKKTHQRSCLTRKDYPMPSKTGAYSSPVRIKQVPGDSEAEKPGKSIRKKIDEASDVNGGYSGKIPKDD